MFSRKKKDESEFSKLRQRQLDDLLKFNPTCTLQSSKDLNQTIYQLVISTTYGPLTMHIILPATFPERSPSIRVLSRVTHHWLDKDMYVTGHTQLGSRWGPHDSLGRVVREIHTEFSRNPPKPQTLFGGPANSFTPVSPMQTATISPSTSLTSLSSSALSSSSSSASTSRTHTRSPDIPQSFDFLDTMSIVQLEELCHDYDALQEIVENMSSVKSMNTVRDDLYAGVEDLAKKNLAKKTEHEAMLQQLQQLQTHVEQNQAIFNQLAQRQQAALNNYSIRTIVSLLDEAIIQSEQASDNLKERYERKDDLNHSTFIDEYIAARRLYHQRSAKRERLQEAYGRG